MRLLSVRVGPHPHAPYALRATPFGLAAALRAAAYSMRVGPHAPYALRAAASSLRWLRAYFALIAALLIVAPTPARAQAPDQPPPPPSNGFEAAQVDLNLIDLPTTMSLKKHQSYFRLTHRFARDLRRGDFGQLAEDLFSLDNGAVIGLEYRFGILSNLQAGVHRSTLSKTIQFFGKYDAVKQGGAPVAVSVFGSVEGLDNFHDHYQPGIAATISRSINPILAVYATPAFVWHTRAADELTGHEGHDHGDLGTVDDDDTGHQDTLFLGFGARVRFRPTGFIVGEYSPRLAGHDPGRGVWGVAIEKRTSGHTLQLNFTNAFGTTLGEIARGGSTHDIYLGFNLTRRF
jgi:hypothetical protein